MPSLPALDIKTNINHSPHVVILGAGASCAAFPKGDANGRQLPLMNDLVDVTGLKRLLQSAGIRNEGRDFEAFYDEIASSGRHTDLVREIERRIREYFAGMSLPPEVTLYDYLVLSLRAKDLIATFNWDPFLAQAYRRNMRITELPQIAFLHGNVEVGQCNEHRKKGFMDQPCEDCRQELRPTKLLYPVRQKRYSDNPFIENEWNVLRDHLVHAYLLTIFGYAAPATDVEAKRLMLETWKNNPTLPLAEVEIIDIKEEEELEVNWNEFFHSHHYAVFSDVRHSFAFNHPWRSCEAFAMATLQNQPWKDNQYPHFEALGDLHDWLSPLIAEERKRQFTGEPCAT